MKSIAVPLIIGSVITVAGLAADVVLSLKGIAVPSVIVSVITVGIAWLTGQRGAAS